tara:strand:+ start:4163 stop:4636 length:474 start_codon:yes stop_codon:yes gene_type:complete
MSRSLSAETLKALYAQETGVVFVMLLTLDHESLSEPIRVCSDSKQLTSRGNVFIAYPFEVVLPEDREDATLRAQLVIDNIGREVMLALKKMTTAARVTIEIVRTDAPDRVEAAFPDFRLTNVKYNALTIKGDLMLEDFTAEPYPHLSFTPSSFPALF